MTVVKEREGRIEIVTMDTAVELLDWLVPWSPVWWRRGGADAWGFRGQRDAGWQLVPAAMRENAFRLRDGSPRSVSSVDEQLQAEGDAVTEFVNVCDRAGLPLPEDGQWLRSPELIGSFISTGLFRPRPFPFPLVRSLYALAQHHGVPTRLLDWTKSPLVAAYFACEEVAKNAALLDAGGRCAVWAAHQDIITALQHNDFRVVKVTAPFESNPNLRAQRGLFSLIEHKTQPTDFRLPHLDDLVRDIPVAAGGADVPLIIKMTIPLKQCSFLLQLLDDANVNAATVFPGYDGAVEAVRERQFHAKSVPGP